ncbi:hypothetical protein [Rhodococcus sp. Leaf233]|uniref:hypothetical protein n=1 Tax=Rhodococcus sp. Leaf233 TaxID=1736302 RepID=UPI0007110338|nr:hypothetical protein [Rhodococcus sp. Leaf233]KQU33534.1 hypothetical protein ASH04_06770 [Rhodococcus sp. Leaf233]
MNKALEASARNSWMETFTERDETPREPLRFGIEEGIAWGAVGNPMGSINGYAWIPREGHPWSTVDSYEDERLNDVEVHGGFTFCRNGWIGFDTLHAWDVWDPAHLEALNVPARHGRRYLQEEWDSHLAKASSWDRVWTIDQVVAEAQKLARQIASAA